MKNHANRNYLSIVFTAIIVIGSLFGQPTEQTITFLGGYGNQGDVDPYTEASLDGGETWASAYLTGWHPWGFAQGTNSWINFDPSPFVGLNTTTDYRIRFMVPADFTDPSMVFVIKADNRATLWVNDTFISTFDGQGSGAAGDQVVAQAIEAGLNEIRLRLQDWGGWVGLNYRIDVTMTSSEDISDYVLTIEEAEEIAGTISRTSWEMNRGGSYFEQPVSDFGAVESYNQAVIPSTEDPNWEPAPDPEIIGFSEYSILPGGCLSLVDYTYFQTFVNVPTGMAVTQFTIDFSGIDDGGRVTIFNSDYPSGVVVPGSYVYLGGTGTANLADYVADGENRVVVTQVDNCPTGNNLQVAQVVLNGETISADVTNTAPVAAAGPDQSFSCVIESAAVTLDGSASSDADGDALSYSWSLDGNEVSTAATFSTSLSGGSHIFTLTVSDGEESVSDEAVVVVTLDETAPVVSLNGDDPLVLPLYLNFTDPGVTVEDACDTDPVVIQSSTVDLSAPGTYAIAYTATDAAGNSAEAIREVIVVNQAPEVADAIEDFELQFGTAGLVAVVDLLDVFTDGDGDSLSFSMSNSDAVAVETVLDGSILTMTALDLGTSSINLTATDIWDASAEDEFELTVNVADDLAAAVAFSLDKTDIKKDTDVLSGNLLVNNPAPLYVKHHGDDDDDDEDDEDDDDEDDDKHTPYSLRIAKDSFVAAGYVVKADILKIEKNTTVESDVTYNTLYNRGSITGGETSGLVTPQYVNLPPFKSAEAGTENVRINRRQSIELAPGSYGKVDVKDYASLTLTGGTYNFESIKLSKGAKLRFAAEVDLRIAEKLETGNYSYVGPADGALIDASGSIIYVGIEEEPAALAKHKGRKRGGDDDDDDDDDDEDDEEDDDDGKDKKAKYPKVKFGAGSKVYTTVYSPEGKIEVKSKVEFAGALWAATIKVDKDSDLSLDSYFGTDGSNVLAKRGTWVEPEFEVMPEAYALEQNYPNPFNPTTNIAYEIAEPGFVRLTVFNVLGQEVADLVSRHQNEGRYQVAFDASHLSSGTYFYVLESGKTRLVNKMILVK